MYKTRGNRDFLQEDLSIPLKNFLNLQSYPTSQADKVELKKPQYGGILIKTFWEGSAFSHGSTCPGGRGVLLSQLKPSWMQYETIEISNFYFKNYSRARDLKASARVLIP